MADRNIKPFYAWRTAFQQSDLPPTTKLILFCISSYMNERNESAFPSIETLIRDSSLSNRAVITHIKKAEEEGFLKVSRHGLAGQAWKRNKYTISLPKVVKEVHDVEHGKVVNLTTEGSEPNDIKVVKEVHTNSTREYQENIPKEEFNTFWKDYGKVGNRKTAFKKFILVRKKVELEVLEKANEYYDDHLSKNSWQSKQHLTTWLNQDGWENQYGGQEKSEAEYQEDIVKAYFAGTIRWLPDKWGPPPDDPETQMTSEIINKYNNQESENYGSQ